MYMASQKQIDFVNRIESVVDKKYIGLYDSGSISEFIRNNIKEYDEICSSSYWEGREDLYDLIDEHF